MTSSGEALVSASREKELSETEQEKRQLISNSLLRPLFLSPDHQLGKKSEQITLLVGRKPSDGEKNAILAPVSLRHRDSSPFRLILVEMHQYCSNNLSPKTPLLPGTSHCPGGLF